MKALSLIILTAFLLSLQSETNFSEAKVQQVNNVFIFIYSAPAHPYITLGSFKVKQEFTGEPAEQVRTAMKKLRKEYPSANGLLFTDDQLKQADAIRFQ